MLRILIALFVAAVVATAGQAQVVSIDLSKLDATKAGHVLDAKRAIDAAIAEAAPSPVVVVDQAKKWADVGENLAKAIAATAKALSIEVNDFVRTPFGWWASIFIVVYFFGAKVWVIAAGTTIWMSEVLNGMQVKQKYFQLALTWQHF